MAVFPLVKRDPNPPFTTLFIHVLSSNFIQYIFKIHSQISWKLQGIQSQQSDRIRIAYPYGHTYNYFAEN